MAALLKALAVSGTIWLSGSPFHEVSHVGELVGPPEPVRVGPGWVRFPPPSKVRRGLAALPRKRPTPVTRPEAEPTIPPGGTGGNQGAIGGGGIGGIGGGGGSVGFQPPSRRSIWPREDTGPEYLGTVIHADPRQTGYVLRFQEAFTVDFAKADPRPLSRTTHLDWLPHYDAYPVRNLGWRGDIVRTVPQDDGSWTVTIHFKPNLYSTSLKTWMGDYVEETYRVEGPKIELIDSDAARPKTRFQGFPAAI